MVVFGTTSLLEKNIFPLPVPDLCKIPLKALEAFVLIHIGESAFKLFLQSMAFTPPPSYP